VVNSIIVWELEIINCDEEAKVLTYETIAATYEAEFIF